MKRLGKIVFITCLSTLVSCISTRKVPDGKQLLTSNQLELKTENPGVKSADLKTLIKQQPNPHFWIFSPKLWFYGFYKPEKTGFMNRIWKAMGEPPVIYDSLYAEQTSAQIHSYLLTKGHFRPDVEYTTKIAKRNPKKMDVIYNVNTHEGYRFSEVDIQVDDDTLKPYLERWPYNTTLKTGQYYDVDAMNKERLRIELQLQNQGFYKFNRDYIGFVIDSTIGDYKMNVLLQVHKPEFSGDTTASPYFQRYLIKDVMFYPEYNNNVEHLDTTLYVTKRDGKDKDTNVFLFIHDEDLRIRPKVMVNKSFLVPEHYFSMKDVAQTYENLSDMKVFRYINVRFTEVKDSTPSSSPYGFLDAHINTKQSLKQALTLESELTTSSGTQGIAGSILFQNKNIFGGAEILNIRLRGVLQVQKRSDDWYYSFETRAEAGIEFPRFLAPFSQERISKYFRPKTTITGGVSYQYKPDQYERWITTASFGYNWRKNKVYHAFFPIEANAVSIVNMTDEFKKYIEDNSKTNLRLKYQYTDHFISDMRYVFIYNGQDLKRNVDFNFLRVTLESAGNILDGIASATNFETDSMGARKIFGLVYSQYFRFEVDFKHQFYLPQNQVFVARAYVGAGFPYGNADYLPYEKGFYGGGTNNIRAWPLYLLGPGSYYDPMTEKDERVGDMSIVLNAEYRFPIYNSFKGALFADIGNVWLNKPNTEFPDGDFRLDDFYKEFAVGAGIGLRIDWGFFVIRLDAAIPTVDPAKPLGERFVLPKQRFSDFVLNFGVGYPF